MSITKSGTVGRAGSEQAPKRERVRVETTADKLPEMNRKARRAARSQGYKVEPSAPAAVTLLPHQLAALRALASDPAAYVEAGTLAYLRRNMLVGKHVGNDERGRQKTTSPITDAGRDVLAAAGG